MALALRLVPRPPLPRPTEAELDALRSALTSGSRKGAADELEISDSAVKERLKGLYRRIGVLDRAQAVAWLDDHHPGWRERMPV
jgi:DNA-binding NarL/FixJ family response regulator